MSISQQHFLALKNAKLKIQKNKLILSTIRPHTKHVHLYLYLILTSQKERNINKRKIYLI